MHYTETSWLTMRGLKTIRDTTTDNKISNKEKTQLIIQISVFSYALIILWVLHGSTLVSFTKSTRFRPFRRVKKLIDDGCPHFNPVSIYKESYCCNNNKLLFFKKKIMNSLSTFNNICFIVYFFSK